MDNKNNDESKKVSLSLEKDDLDEKIQEVSKENDKFGQIENEFKDDKKPKKIKKEKIKDHKLKSSSGFLLLFFVIIGLFTILLFAIGQEPTWTIQYLYYKYYWFYNGFIVLITLTLILIGTRKLGVFKSMLLLPLCLIIILLFSFPLIYFTTDLNMILSNPISYFKDNIFDFAFLDFLPVTSCIIISFILMIIIQTIAWIKKREVLKLIGLYVPIIVLIGAAIYFFGVNPIMRKGQNGIQVGSAGLKGDLDYILENEKKYNLDFKSKEDQEALEKNINILKGKVSEEGFENLIVELKRLNASYIDQNNDMSYVGKAFPFVLYGFNDGYYVVSNSKQFDNIYGKKLISINGKKVEDLEKQFLEISSFGSQTRLKSLFAIYLSDYTILKGLNIVNSEECNFIFQNGASSINVTATALDQRELSKQMQNNNYELDKTFVFRQNKLFVEQKNSILRYVYQNYDSSVNFENVKILDYLKTKTIKTFFIDLRNSGEGNSKYFTKLANAIKYRRIKIDNIICATDKDTVLSSVVAAQNVKEILNGISIGQDTGGSISNCTNNRAFITPNNNIKFNIVTKDNKTKGKSPISVDKIINLNSLDYFTNKDPVYEYIKSL